MNDLGDDTGSIVGRWLGRLGDMFMRNRQSGNRLYQRRDNTADNTPDDEAKKEAPKPTSQKTGESHARNAGPIDRGVIASGRVTEQNFKSILVEKKQSYDFLSAIYAREGIKFFGEWDTTENEGVFVLETAQFDKAERAVQETLEAINKGELTREAVLEKSPEIEALENDRILLEFTTRENDTKASIITNALKREGAEEVSVTEPDFESNVTISVRSQDAPCLVRVADDYIKKGTIDRGRFKNIDDVKRRVEARERAASIRKKESNSPAASKDNAARAAKARNRDRATTPPARTQAR